MEGKLVITTQPEDQALILLELLRDAGATAFNLPMIETRTITIDKNIISNVLSKESINLIIFTSRKGVRGFFENVAAATGTFHIPGNIKTAAVGKATAEEIKNYNTKADYVNPGNDAASLADYLIKEKIVHGKKILLALGNLAPGFLPETFSAYADTIRLNVYETLEKPVSDEKIAGYIKNKTADICIFTSPSGFSSFRKQFSDISDLKFAAIGKTTAAAIANAGYKSAVTASNPDMRVFVKELADYFNTQKD
jgi:uroporphyrinogen-III synthase